MELNENSQYFHMVCSSLGVIPIVFSFCTQKTILIFASTVSTFLAVSHVAVEMENNNRYIVNVTGAADAICGVFVTLAIAYSLSLFNNCMGFFRVLWLTGIVTSSNGYKFFEKMLGEEYVPTNITIISLSVCIIVLFACTLYAKCNSRRSSGEQGIKHQIAEASLIFGALALRFDHDITRVIKLNIGFDVWHVCSWVSMTICCFINDNQHIENTEEDDVNQV